MGNDSSNPYPKYQFPYRQPDDYTWRSYIEFCSCQSEQNIKNNFQDNYRNKTIDLEGYITELTVNQAQLLLNPSDAYSTNSEVTLNMNKDVLDSYGPNAFVLNQPVRFRGKFTSIGTIRNHQMELVKLDPNTGPELEITYEHFLSLFGSKAQKQADYYFTHHFQNEMIQVKGIIQGNIPNANHEQPELLIPFQLIVDDPNIPNEQVKLLIDQTQRSQAMYNIITIRQLKSNIPILVTLKYHQRGNPHILSLVSIDHVYNQNQSDGGIQSNEGNQSNEGIQSNEGNQSDEGNQSNINEQSGAERVSGFWGQIGSSIASGFNNWIKKDGNQKMTEKDKQTQNKKEIDNINEQRQQQYNEHLRYFQMHREYFEKYGQQWMDFGNWFGRGFGRGTRGDFRRGMGRQIGMDYNRMFGRGNNIGNGRQIGFDPRMAFGMDPRIYYRMWNGGGLGRGQMNEYNYNYNYNYNMDQKQEKEKEQDNDNNKQKEKQKDKEKDSIKQQKQESNSKNNINQENADIPLQSETMQMRMMERLRRLQQHENRRRERRSKQSEKTTEKRKKREEKLKKKEDKKQKKNEKYQKKLEKHQKKLEKIKEKQQRKKSKKINNEEQQEDINGSEHDVSDDQLSEITPVSEVSPISEDSSVSAFSNSSQISNDSIDQYIHMDINSQGSGSQLHRSSDSLNSNSQTNSKQQMSQSEIRLREEKEREIERERERRHVLDEGADWAYNNNDDNNNEDNNNEDNNNIDNNTQSQIHIQQQQSQYNDHPFQLPPQLIFSQQHGVLPISSSSQSQSQQQSQSIHPNINPNQNDQIPTQIHSDNQQQLEFEQQPALRDLRILMTYEEECTEGFICPITQEVCFK